MRIEKRRRKQCAKKWTITREKARTKSRSTFFWLFFSGPKIWIQFSFIFTEPVGVRPLGLRSRFGSSVFQGSFFQTGIFSLTFTHTEKWINCWLRPIQKHLFLAGGKDSQTLHHFHVGIFDHLGAELRAMAKKASERKKFCYDFHVICCELWETLCCPRQTTCHMGICRNRKDLHLNNNAVRCEKQCWWCDNSISVFSNPWEFQLFFLFLSLSFPSFLSAESILFDMWPTNWP